MAWQRAAQTQPPSKTGGKKTQNWLEKTTWKGELECCLHVCKLLHFNDPSHETAEKRSSKTAGKNPPKLVGKKTLEM